MKENDIIKHIQVSLLSYEIENWLLNSGNIREQYQTLELFIDAKYKQYNIEGLTLKKYNYDETGMTAVTFQVDETNRFLTGFAGTNLTPENTVEDLVADATILLGFNRQSSAAYMYMNELIQEYPDILHQLTGHSLGMGIAYDIGSIFNLDVIGFNGAPGSIGIDIGQKLNKNRYDGTMINFVMQNDFLYLLTTIGAMLGFSWYQNQQNYVLKGTTGHDLSHFMDNNILMQMQTVLSLKKHSNPDSFVQEISLDIENTGNARFFMTIEPQEFTAYNLLGVSTSISTQRRMQINPESLQQLAIHLRHIKDWDFEGQIQTNNLYSKEKNELMKTRYQPRVDAAEQALLQKYEKSGYVQTMLSLNESLDHFAIGTTEGKQNRQLLRDIEQLNCQWLQAYFSPERNYYWRILHTETQWGIEEVLQQIGRVKQAIQGLHATLAAKQFEEVCYPRATKNGMKFAQTGAGFIQFFQTFETKIKESLEGEGNRSGLKDGIAQALEHVIEVMIENKKKVCEHLEMIAVCTNQMAVSFSTMDENIALSIATKSLPQIETIQLPLTFELFLKTYNLFEDVDVLSAYAQQIASKSQEVSMYLLQETTSLFNEIQNVIKPFISEITSMDKDVRILVQTAQLQLEKVEKIIYMKENTYYEVNPLTNVYEDVIHFEEHNEIKQHELTTLEECCWEFESLRRLEHDVLPLSAKLSQALGVIQGFLLEQENLPQVMKNIVEEALYAREGLSDIVSLQRVNINLMKRIVEQLKMLQLDLASENQSFAIEYLGKLVYGARQQIEYLIQLEEKCFSVK